MLWSVNNCLVYAFLLLLPIAGLRAAEGDSPQQQPPATATTPGSSASTYEQLLQAVVDLRFDIELQRREIRALHEEVAQLRAQLEGRPYRKSLTPGSYNTAENLAESSSPAAPPPTADRATAPVKKAEAGERVYRVKSGDTLTAIAKRSKVSLEALRQANPGIEERSLAVGAELKLP